MSVKVTLRVSFFPEYPKVIVPLGNSIVVKGEIESIMKTLISLSAHEFDSSQAEQLQL